MFSVKLLRWAGMATLFFFVFFLLPTDMVQASEEDDLLKARRLYQQGDYEGSIKLLSGFVKKLEKVVKQKKKVADAFYLLAKIYFEVGDDEQVDDNLRNVYNTFPTYSVEETNLGFKERSEAIKREVLTKKAAAGEIDEETLQKEEQKVIPQKAVKKKKKKFPLLLVLGGVVVVGVVLLLVLKKSDDKEEEFDIRGEWRNTLTVNNENIVVRMEFRGQLRSGTFVDQWGDTGTYTVRGLQVEFEYDDFFIAFTGRFNGQNNMSGTFDTAATGSGTWNAERIGNTPVPADSGNNTVSPLQTLKERNKK